MLIFILTIDLSGRKLILETDVYCWVNMLVFVFHLDMANYTVFESDLFGLTLLPRRCVCLVILILRQIIAFLMLRRL